MSAEKIAEKVGSATSRKGFLARAGGVGTATVAGILGLNARSADATVYVHGCNFCRSPVSSFIQCPYNSVCTWCWWGNCHGSPRHKHQCCEGYTRSGGCGPGCAYNNCSYYGGKRNC